MAHLPAFAWLVVPPGGVSNMPLACEASRAGAWGFVDLEDVVDEEGLRRDLGRVASDADVPVGAKLDGTRSGIWGPLLTGRQRNLARILLTRPASSPAELRPTVSELQRRGLEVLVEAVSVAEALAAEEAGVDGIVAKGSEAGGRVGDETCFLLMQRLAGRLSTPVYAQGGVGLHTAAACRVAGARGALLDWQVSLVEESRLGADERRDLSRLDGSETVLVGRGLGDAYRLHVRPGSPALDELLRQEQRWAAAEELSEAERIAGWRGVVDETLAGTNGDVRRLGMDVSFAERLAARFRTIGNVLDEMDRSLRFHVSRARQAPPLRPGGGVASVLGTRHPIVQGPMSRVSDTAPFAAAVAEAGALPVMAVAAMGEDELEAMLKETAERLQGAPWGAGLLGFLPAEQYGAQIELVKKYRPSTVVIAGGRPTQARQLEEEGIPAFIHVPSHRLLALYLEDGIRNMIFEGEECGGHIGRYSAFVLWENAIEVLLAGHPPSRASDRCAALFAGGISTALSAAMVSSIVAPLADHGVDVGVLVGTAYLFTREAVEGGAIGAGFQSAVVEARETSILDCGGGYRIRAAPTPFCHAFEEEKQRLTDEGLSAEEVRMSLEHLTLGRLRIAAKGLRFNLEFLEDDTVPETLTVSEPEQKQDGVYMAGQTILLHDSVYSVEDLHRRISEGGAELLQERTEPSVTVSEDAPMEIAIVGLSGLFPGAADIDNYWENILAGQYSITQVPPEQWNAEAYLDADPKSRDKIYSHWGGFVDPVEFDPLKYGIPPRSLSSIDPVQILTLEMVDRALRDAGYDHREFDRENTSVFVGEGGGMGNLGQLYSFRSLLPMFLESVPEDLLAQLPEWTEDSFPGLLPNVIAGRVTNQFDLGGTNLSTSAACAAGLAALSLGMDELRAGESNMSIVAAVDVQQNPFIYLCFSKTMALSPTGTPRCFDASADGIVISQGLGVVILKRREDAERDGDRIYAVLRGMGSSSDGRGKSLTAPTSRGQLHALHRAYGQAGFGLDTVELIEAHGTGTVLGDRTEAESITHALREAGAPPRGCAVGTVKSMIGHTKGCAGIAGLIKVALALHHKVLPPTLWVEKPTAAPLWAGDGPAYLNTGLRPWVGRGHPRRAGVSSFGFGGTNFHAVLEEHRPSTPRPRRFPSATLPAELFGFRSPTGDGLREDVDTLLQATEKTMSLRELAHGVFRKGQERGPTDTGLSLAIVAESVDDLARKLERARSALASASELQDPTGVYFDPAPVGRDGQVALVFPGQGSQRVDMLKDLALLFDEVRESLAVTDEVLASRLPFPLSHYVYPPASFTEEEQTAAMEALTRTDVTQPALGAVEIGLHKVLRAFGIRPDMAAGHSVGEYVALAAAGALDERALAEVLWTRGDCMLRAAGGDTGTMMAIRGGRERVEELLQGEEEIYVANINGPRQTVVSGRREALETLQARLAEREIHARLLPVGCGFHSPFVEKAASEFERALAGVDLAPTDMPVYSNHLAAPLPREEADVRRVLGAHLSHPVRFLEEIRRMHEDGARLFVEVGPGRVCSNLVGEILDGAPHRAIACDGAPSRVGTVRFLHALAQLFAQGVDMRLDPLFNRRPEAFAATTPGAEGPATPTSPKVTWMVSPEVSWPAGTPRPRVTPLPSLPGAPAPGAPAKHPIAPSSHVPAAPGGGAAAERSLVPPSNTPPAPAAPSAPTDAPAVPDPDGPLAEVLLRHQQLMATFVEQQTQVMLKYLETRQGTSTAHTAIRPRPPAGLGLTPLAPPPPQAPSAPAPAPAAVPAGGATPPRPEERAAPAPSGEDLLQQLAAFVGERTGYPDEMLTGEREMERDLGIDSIKRVEILTSFARQFPTLRSEAVEQLREARTLQDVVEAIRANLNGSQPGSGTATAAPEAVAPADKPTPVLAPSGEDLLQQLAAFVGERTGYPDEMLTGEREMERDLGIDSIKRVEILTSFARQFPTLRSEAVEQLREARTLQDVVEAIRANLDGGPSAASPGAAAPTSDPAPAPKETAARAGLDRYVIGMKESPLAATDAVPLPEGALLITDDGNGAAARLREQLRDLGGRPVLVRLEGPEEDGVYAADIGDTSEAQALVDRVRRDHGPIGGVVHLLPLRQVPPVHELSVADFDRLVREEVKGLFHLLRAAASDLKSTPGSWAFTGLSFGASPANGSLPVPEHPWRGGLVGVIKTVAVEWPEVLAKSLAWEGRGSGELVRELLAEASAPREEHEVYYRAGTRLVPEPRKLELSAELEAVELGPEDVILLIGGARGITSEVALEIAEGARPTLVLVGRSPWPDPEPAATAGAVSDRDLRRVLFAGLQAEGKDPSPIEVDRTARRILREREMRRSRSLMEAAGSRVFYYAADMRDAASTEELFQRIYETHGRLDGVVCGAGVIEDKLIEDKTTESFDRVFDTKVRSIFHLARAVRPEALKFFVMFSSVAGWTGNPGQVDYVAANEVLNRMALHLSARWSRRVVAIDWGPWDRAGMVTPETRRQFLERGVGLVPPDAGRHFLVDEIRFGSPSDPIIGAMGRLEEAEPGHEAGTSGG